MKPRTQVDHDTGEVTRTHTIRITPCDKQGYSSRKIAAMHAALQSRSTGQKITAYHCTHAGCHCYHVGHKPGTR